MLLSLLLACQREPAGPQAAWDAPAGEVTCEAGRGAAPLLGLALDDAGLERADLRVREADWDLFSDLVSGPFALPWWEEVHHHPEQVDCFHRQLQADLDAAGQGPHPASAVLAAWAGWLDHPLDPAPPDRAAPFPLELATLAAVTGASGDPWAAAADLDPAVGEALAPVLRAVSRAVVVRERMVDAARAALPLSPRELFDGAAGRVLVGRDAVPDPASPADVEAFATWYQGPDGPRALSDAARRIARAVEDAPWPGIAGGAVAWRFDTPAGAVIVAGGEADTHGKGAVLLLVDLGGDDRYEGSAGANARPDNGVSVAIDLGGADAWAYPEAPDPGDPPGGPAADADGRGDVGGYPVSLSETDRQGSGRLGIGMVFDLGQEPDAYTSLRGSQGFGALGLGLLYDAGGDDTYLGEAGVQGAGIFGAGLLIDGGGDDAYRAWAFAQGFGYVGAGGLALDLGDGADSWYSDPGRDYGGTTLYASAQLAGGEGNSSFTQGAGFGLRGDPWGQWWPGGLGVLRDGGGDDTYVAGVFAQGTGYWQGTGLLADADGDDRYDAIWYVQGGAAHFALGVLVDGAGDDVYGGTIAPRNVSLGSGHDLSVGVLVDGAGDDTYTLTTLAGGASNCQGIGIFADLDGKDAYLAASTYGVGLGNHSGECDDSTGRTAIPSIGLFLDAGGDADAWTWPADDARAPGDDRSFGVAWSGGADEHGGAVDGDGGAGFRALP